MARADGTLGRLFQFLAQLAAADGAARRWPSALAAIACVLLAALGAAAAVGCLVTALWLLALPWIGPVATPLLCGAALMLVGSTLLLIGINLLWRMQPAPPPVLIELLQHVDAQRLIRDHKSDLLISAFIIGLVAGDPAPKPLR